MVSYNFDNSSNLESSFQRAPHTTQSTLLGSTTLWSCVVLLGLLILASIVTLASTPLQNLDARRVVEVNYSETLTPTPFDITAGSEKDVRLPYGRCCTEPYAVFNFSVTPADVSLDDPAILIPRAVDNSAIYIDGIWVAGRGDMTFPVSRYGMWSHLFRLPPESLASGKEVQVIVARDKARKLLRPVYVGEYKNLKRANQQSNMTRVYFPTINAIIGIFVALLCAVAAPLFAARGVLLSLALFMASWAAITIIQFVPNPLVTVYGRWIIYYSAFWAILASACCFIAEWTSAFPSIRDGFWGRLARPISEVRRKKLHLIVFTVWLIATLLTVYLVSSNAAKGATTANKLVTWTALLLMPIFALRMIAYYWDGKKGTSLEALAFILIISAAAADMGMIRFLDKEGVFFPTASLFFPFALLISLARRAQGVFDAATTTNVQLNTAVQRAKKRIIAGQEEIREREKDAALMEERSRIMRDMHDGIGGQLVSLLTVVRATPSTPENIEHSITSAIDDLRLVIDSLDSVGDSLDVALAIFNERTQTKLAAAGIQLRWRNQLGDPAEGFNPRDILQIYRIMQEAITNIVRHSKATEAKITIERTAGKLPLLITIMDNGVGINGESKSGKGRQSMATRAVAIGGSLKVDDANPGTRIRLRLPEGRM